LLHTAAQFHDIIPNIVTNHPLDNLQVLSLLLLLCDIATLDDNTGDSATRGSDWPRRKIDPSKPVSASDLCLVSDWRAVCGLLDRFL
jgi:hypothetical protein